MTSEANAPLPEAPPPEGSHAGLTTGGQAESALFVEFSWEAVINAETLLAEGFRLEMEGRMRRNAAGLRTVGDISSNTGRGRGRGKVERSHSTQPLWRC